jgi:hypothetical protein
MNTRPSSQDDTFPPNGHLHGTKHRMLELEEHSSDSMRILADRTRRMDSQVVDDLQMRPKPREWNKRGLERRMSIDVNTASSNGSFHLEKMRVPEPFGEVRTEVLPVPKITNPLGKRTRNISMETANASINEVQFHTISQMGGAGWFYDQNIDMGFDFIPAFSTARNTRSHLATGLLQATCS